MNPKVKRATKPMRRFVIHGWMDNYYSNLLDWSYNNFICAGVNQTLYIYNMALDDVGNEYEKNRYTRSYFVDCSF